MKHLITIVLLCLQLPGNLHAQEIPSPEQKFGFKMGSDRQLINWQQIVDYFELLDSQSRRVKVVQLGNTTLDRPMIMAIISSAGTIQNLETYQAIQERIAHPYDLTASAADSLISKGKLVLLLTLNIHSTEIAASQESVELAYELATAIDEKSERILDNVILLLIPSLNPDGQDMITNWYLKDVGTPYEGHRMPMKYHHYADHDNNRDWFFFNLVESQLVASVLYHDWYPEIVYDQHQMGSRGARFFLPPYADPVNPNIPPSLTANVNMLGKHVLAEMHDQGFKGLVSGTNFNAYFQGTMSKTPLWHNRIGILSEAASVWVASPVFFPKTSLRGMGIDLPQYAQQTNFLDPWPGGWWKLRDIIEYEKAATYAMLDLAATYKQRFKKNYYTLNRQAIARGKSGKPFAYVVPMQQHDPGSAVEMLKRLRYANVAVQRAVADFSAAGNDYHKDDYIIPLAQPARAYIKDLMEVQHYPDLREYPGGPPRQPYDVTAWTLPLQFGIRCDRIDEPFQAETVVAEPQLTTNPGELADGWYALERRFLFSYQAVNRLLQAGIQVYELKTEWQDLPEGTFVFAINQKSLSATRTAFAEIMVQPAGIKQPDTSDIRPLKAAKIAVYQPWRPSAYDEGWLRLVLDNFDFPYDIIHNAGFKSPEKMQSYDVIIFGSQSNDRIIDGKPRNAGEPTLGDAMVRKEFGGGIGSAGVEQLRKFLRKGGSIQFLGDACNMAIESLHLPATNALKNSKQSEYFAPGSLFEIQLNKSSPLTYGMRNSATVYVNNRLALTLKPYTQAIAETGYYAGYDLLRSGWVVGEKNLHNKIALAEIPVGDGMAIMYAFRPQHRGQTFGTFKLLFNAYYEESKP